MHWLKSIINFFQGRKKEQEDDSQLLETPQLPEPLEPPETPQLPESWIPATVRSREKRGFFVICDSDLGTILVPTPPRKVLERNGEEPIWKESAHPYPGAYIEVKAHYTESGLSAHDARFDRNLEPVMEENSQEPN
ncbi:MAG: hypothetical protein CMB80_05425 [Flammeovirgaceae bacterium]|nr:hypothetical protein [Flammeovirgaceae bacterium]|tara:strand:+ start:245 stop:652 length:408 start_codon:yes stop_codon:yes gene_type:complete